MYLKVRDERRDNLRKPISAKGFWGTVLITAVLVGCICYFPAWEAKHPAWSSFWDWLWFGGVWLLAVSTVLMEYAQHKRWKLPFVLFALVVTVTLSTFGHRFPHSVFAAQWVVFIGNAMLCAMIVSFYAEFGWGRRKTPEP